MLEATRMAWGDAEAELGSGADYTAVIKWLERLQLPPEVREKHDTAGGSATG
jgi:hypothetical protein